MADGPATTDELLFALPKHPWWSVAAREGARIELRAVGSQWAAEAFYTSVENDHEDNVTVIKDTPLLALSALMRELNARRDRCVAFHRGELALLSGQFEVQK